MTRTGREKSELDRNAAATVGDETTNRGKADIHPNAAISFVWHQGSPTIERRAGIAPCGLSMDKATLSSSLLHQSDRPDRLSDIGERLHQLIA